MMNEFLHEGEDVGIVGGGGQHQLAVPESVLHGLGHVAPGEVVHDDLGAALVRQLLRQQLCRRLRVAVDGGVGDHNAVALHPVGRPDVVQIQIIPQILRQHGAMQGADDGNVQPGGLFQQRLHLRAVLAHDADVVPAGFVRPVFFHVQSTELAEAVSGEENLVIGIIGHNDLRPVNHGRTHKGQGVLAQAQGIALAHHNAPIGVVVAEEVLHHHERLGGGNHGRLGVDLQEIGDVGRVVRLHVLHHQVVRLAAAQGVLNVVQPLMGKAPVYGVHDGDLFVHDGVGIVAHAARDNVLSLEQVDRMVVDADVPDVLCDCHKIAPFLCYYVSSARNPELPWQYKSGGPCSAQRFCPRIRR